MAVFRCGFCVNDGLFNKKQFQRWERPNLFLKLDVRRKPASGWMAGADGQVDFRFDTGANFSCLTRRAAENLGMSLCLGTGDQYKAARTASGQIVVGILRKMYVYLGGRWLTSQVILPIENLGERFKAAKFAAVELGISDPVDSRLLTPDFHQNLLGCDVSRQFLACIGDDGLHIFFRK